MPDEPDPPEKAVLPKTDDVAATPASVEDGSSSMPGGAPLMAGQRWHTYQIEESLVSDVGWLFSAVNVSMLEKVLVRVLPITEQTEVRAQAWCELLSIDHAGLLKGIAAYEEDGYRYEVSHMPPDITLRRWAGAPEQVELLVDQIAAVLVILHDRGVVHLNLRPDNIYVMQTEEGLQVGLGGLEYATVYNQPELIPVPVDPLYAPPEAAGLVKHQPGAELRAWDWWSLGRVIQEVLLGCHVLGLALGRDIAGPASVVRGWAEELLFERNPGGTRAGAVELMPALNPRTGVLLRGLLTSSRDGRWGADEVELWLARAPVKDRYQLGRNEALFAWKDRKFTVPEAADYFSQEENWADGVVNLFATDDPRSLVSFVGERPEYQPVHERIAAWHKFMQVPNWTGLPVEATRAVLASAAWLLLGGEGRKLMICGRRLDAAGLKRLLARDSPVNGIAMIRAMTARPFIQMIEPADLEAARLLSALTDMFSGESFANAARQGWIDLTSDADCERLVLLALESDQRLAERRREIHEHFAGARDAGLHTLLVQPNPSRADLVLLAETAAQPERFAYVTHADWNRERDAGLRQKGGRLATALFWLRLGRALWFGWLVAGPWVVMPAVWLLFAAGAAYLGQKLWALVLVLGFVALRAAMVALVRSLIRRQGLTAPVWSWTSRISLCRTEALAVLDDARDRVTCRDLSREYDRLKGELAALAVSPPPAPVRRPAPARSAWAVGAASWLFLSAGLFCVFWFGTGHGRQPDQSGLTPRPRSPVVEKPTEEEMFFDDPRVPRKVWDEPQPVVVPKVPLARVKSASSEQVALALIDGQKIMMPYMRSTVDALIAVPVNDTAGPGLLIYDTRTRRVVERRVLLPTQLPADKSWFAFGGAKIYYAGEPPPIPRAPKTTAADQADLPERERRIRSFSEEPPAGAEEKATNAQPTP